MELEAPAIPKPRKLMDYFMPGMDYDVLQNLFDEDDNDDYSFDYEIERAKQHPCFPEFEKISQDELTAELKGTEDEGMLLRWGDHAVSDCMADLHEFITWIRANATNANISAGSEPAPEPEDDPTALMRIVHDFSSAKNMAEVRARVPTVIDGLSDAQKAHLRSLAKQHPEMEAFEYEQTMHDDVSTDENANKNPSYKFGTTDKELSDFIIRAVGLSGDVGRDLSNGADLFNVPIPDFNTTGPQLTCCNL